MTAVKTLVATMTLLLVLGLGLLAYGMMQQSREMGRSEGDETFLGLPPATPAFKTLALDEPAGSQIVAARADGRGRLLLTVTGGNQPDRVLVIDLAEGRRLGLITLGGRYEQDGYSASR